MKLNLFVFSFMLMFPAIAPALATPTLESGPKGAVQHKESGWIFPKKVGKMKRKEQPSAVSGTDDVFAQYETGKGDNKVITTVYVYSSDSVALDSTYEGAQKAIVARLQSSSFMAQLWSEGPFVVGSEPKLLGRKSFYKSGLGPTSVAENLYHFDTGKWIVKVRMSGRETVKAYEIGDEFVQSMPWNSLNIADGECNGYSCTTSRPVPIHGMIPEMLALLYTEKHGFSVVETGGNCTSAQIVEKLVANPKLNEKGLALPVEKVADCNQNDRSISFVRFVLPSTMLEKMAKSPDGLTLTSPFTFVMIKRAESLEFAELHDGQMDEKTMDGVLDRIATNKHVIFSTWNLKDGNKSPVIRFLN